MSRRWFPAAGLLAVVTTALWPAAGRAAVITRAGTVGFTGRAFVAPYFYPGLGGYGLAGYGLTGYGLTGYGLYGYGLTGYAGYSPYALGVYPAAYGYGYPAAYGYGLGAYPAGYGYGYGYPGYSPYGLAGYPATYAAPTFYYYTEPTTGYRSRSPAASDTARAADRTRAQIEVRVPYWDAEVWFDGVKRPEQGTVRRFRTPDLTRGERYTYEVRGRWSGEDGPVTRTREITFRAGDRVVVDLRGRR